MAWEARVRAGFETGSIAECIRYYISASDPGISTVQARTGTRSLRINGGAQAAWAFASASRVQVNFACNHNRIGTTGSGGPILLELVTAGGTQICRVQWGRVSDALELYVSGVLQASASPLVSGFANLGVWHDVGFQINIANDATGFASLYINGALALHYSGPIATANAIAMRVGFTSGSASWISNIYLDDVMIDTSTINEPDTAPPNIRLDYKVVTGVSGTPQWSPVGAATNWEAVDDPAGSDADTTYVVTDTNNHRDLYSFGGYTAPDGYIIEAVIPVFVGRKTAASSPMQIEPVVNDGVGIGVAAALDLPSTYAYVWRRYAEKPSGGGWGTALVAGAAIGMDAVVPI